LIVKVILAIFTRASAQQALHAPASSSTASQLDEYGSLAVWFALLLPPFPFPCGGALLLLCCCPDSLWGPLPKLKASVY